MGSLSREIEKYLKALLENAKNGVIEVQRSALSDFFECVPSQINYVLSTRFTPAHGYIVETRRGGGGYVRIIRLNFANSDKLKLLFEEIIGTEISQNQAEGLLEYLKKEGILTRKETLLIKNIISDKVLSTSLIKNQDALRSRILQSVLATILREDI
ncbi:MAG: transcriptional regulator of stress and heat shock response [Clostridia bacterium]|nr:transcriptional regulator of stress and heat shock response [Clostridia bacterium]MDN5324047.1 transcriptional regulator of stress and heat shock response [Clostridia bacterium]